MSKKNEDIDSEFCHIPMGDGTYRDSDQKDKITRMVILGPGCSISSKELFNFLHLLELPINIRLTCYGANLNGEPDYVMEAVNRVRELDPTHIFIKFRGVPPGEAEYKLLPEVSYALEHPKHVELTQPKKIPVDEFTEIVKEIESKK